MSEKVVPRNIKALKDKAQFAGSQASTKAKEKMATSRQRIRDVASEKRNKVVGTLLTKGIDLTERQLSALKKLKKKESKKQN